MFPNLNWPWYSMHMERLLVITIANDVSSRSMRVKMRSICPRPKSMLAVVRLACSDPGLGGRDPYKLGMYMSIEREGTSAGLGRPAPANSNAAWTNWQTIFSARMTSRRLILCTGTALVPEPPFTLEPGDLVAIVLMGGNLAQSRGTRQAWASLTCLNQLNSISLYKDPIPRSV